MRRAFRLRFGRAHIARDVEDELSFHIEMRAKKLMAAGLTPEAAQREARRQFGDVDAVREFCVTMDKERESAMRRVNFVDELRQDLVYAARTLHRNSGFAAVVILMLGLGIGANTAIFTLINAVLLRELPVVNPGQLVAIGEPSRVGSLSNSTSPRADVISYPLYVDLRNGNRLTSGLLASGRTGRIDVLVGQRAGAPEHPRGRLVSGNYFSVLGVPAFMGRTFDGSEDASVGASPVVTISYNYWARRLNRDPNVIGSTLLINGVRFTVIGVTPEYFTGEIVGTQNDIWIPLTMQSTIMPNMKLLNDRGASWLLLLGRLNTGVTLAQAQSGFGTLIRQTLEVHSDKNVTVTPQQARALKVYVSSGAKGFSRVRSTYAVPMLTLMVGVALLLMVICSNVANLLLARAVTRSKEMAVRAAIGAGRLRLVRQLLTESMVLALLGAAVGLVIAYWGSKLLLAFAGEGSPAMVDVGLDLPVIAFTAGLSIAAVALFGLVPALRASAVDLSSTMRANTQSISGTAIVARGHNIPIGKMLVAANVALSLILLVGAALLVRSLQSLQGTDTGLDRDHLLIVDVDVIGRAYHGDRKEAFIRDMTARFQRLPNVVAVSYSENGIFSGTESNTTVQVPGFIARSEGDSSAYYDHIGPGYAHAVGARILQGRDLLETDDAHSPTVALINETMARFYFAGATAVGRTMLIDSTRLQIVGVIADTKDHNLDGSPVRRIFVAYKQNTAGEPDRLRFEIRTAGDPGALTMPVRREIMAADASLGIDGIDPLSKLMQQSIREQRLVANLGSGFGILALLLAAIGLYGVMTYAITRRTREIGLRVALGAQPRDVIGLVLYDALRLVLAGVVIGLPLALLCTRLLRSQLHDVSVTDPASIAVALVVLLTSGVIASLLPALRASRVAPMIALRQE